MKKQKNESGRSMVEMLGVLAIIGVLSIGGIAGYTHAMNRHRANEVLHASQIVLTVEATRNTTDPKNLTADLLGVSDLPGDCWIGSRPGVTDYIYIGGCDDGVMDAIGSIAGNKWKYTDDADCGRFVMAGSLVEPDDDECMICKAAAVCSVIE